MLSVEWKQRGFTSRFITVSRLMIDYCRDLISAVLTLGCGSVGRYVFDSFDIATTTPRTANPALFPHLVIETYEFGLCGW